MVHQSHAGETTTLFTKSSKYTRVFTSSRVRAVSCDEVQHTMWYDTKTKPDFCADQNWSECNVDETRRGHGSYASINRSDLPPSATQRERRKTRHRPVLSGSRVTTVNSLEIGTTKGQGHVRGKARNPSAVRKNYERRRPLLSVRGIAEVGLWCYDIFEWLGATAPLLRAALQRQAANPPETLPAANNRDAVCSVFKNALENRELDTNPSKHTRIRVPFRARQYRNGL